MKKEQLNHMLEMAQNESTPEKVLTEIWYGTTSVKIRKAVASNPNASSEVLKTASRLYLEEVLDNPGFQMIRMFESDVWVNKVYEAYEDPNAFFVKYGRYQSIGFNGELYNKAVLLSKELTAEALNCCILYGSKLALDRVLKNKKARSNIEFLVKEAIYNEQVYCALDLETLLTLYKVKVLNKKELSHSLSRFGIASASSRKRVYSDFINSAIEEYFKSEIEEEKTNIVKLFSKLLMISRSHTLYWTDYFSWKVKSPKKIDFIARVLSTIMSVSGKRYLLSEHRRVLASSICSYAINRFNYSQQTSANIKEIYELFNLYGIKDVFHEFPNLLNLRNYSISELSVDIKEFFVKAGAFGSWAAVSDSDQKYQLFNEINNSIYEKHGVGQELLFNSCSLRKIVSINDSTHVY